MNNKKKKQVSKTETKKNYRQQAVSAITGRIVTAEYAQNNSDTTYIRKIKKK